MKKTISVFISLWLSISVYGVTPVQNILEQQRYGEGLRLIPLIPDPIEGGTERFLTKPRFLKAQQQYYAKQLPYSSKAAVLWVRMHYVSLVDPISKRALLVSLMSDEQIKAYLMRPWGRLNAGLLETGFPPYLRLERPNPYPFVPNAFSSDEVVFRKEVGENMNRYLFNTPAPKKGDEAEEVAWARMNIQTIHNPITKQDVDVLSSPVGEVAQLLKISLVRKRVGLPS